MTTIPRKQPTGKDKLAAALLKIRMGVEGGNWLIPEPLRTEGTSAEICASVDFDHARRHAEGGSIEPQNLFPMMRADHREKSRKDTTEVAKGKRIGKKEEAFRNKLLAKAGAEIAIVEKASRPIPGSKASGIRKKLNGTVEKR
jgi:hypothetical protein